MELRISPLSNLVQVSSALIYYRELNLLLLRMVDCYEEMIKIYFKLKLLIMLYVPPSPTLLSLWSILRRRALLDALSSPRSCFCSKFSSDSWLLSHSSSVLCLCCCSTLQMIFVLLFHYLYFLKKKLIQTILTHHKATGFLI